MARLSGTKKAAIIIVMLGDENASKIFQHLSKEEVKKLGIEVAQLGNVDDMDMQETLREFYSLCMSKKMFAEGGIECVRQMLEKAFGPKIAEDYIKQIYDTLNTDIASSTIKDFDEKSLLKIIHGEHPQTIAFILYNARPEQVSTIISKLPKEIGVEVVSRIAKIKNISPDVLKEMEKLVSRKLDYVLRNGTEEAVDGIEYIADIMNKVNLNVEKKLLQGITEKDPELGEAITKKMFVFEDILLLDPSSLQQVLHVTNKKDLALAIKGSSPEIVDYIYANVSSRVVENIKEEISYMRNVRLTDVENAQQNIVQTIRNMIRAGKVVIDKSGEDGMIG